MCSPEGACKHKKSTRVCDICTTHSAAFQQVSNRVYDHDKIHHVVSQQLLYVSHTTYYIHYILFPMAESLTAEVIQVWHHAGSIVNVTHAIK